MFLVTSKRPRSRYLAGATAGERSLRFVAGETSEHGSVHKIEIAILLLVDQHPIQLATSQTRGAMHLAKQRPEAADNLAAANFNAVRHGVSLTSTTPEGLTR